MLTVPRKITYKIPVLVYNILHDPVAPAYIQALVLEYTPTRSPRSQSYNFVSHALDMLTVIVFFQPLPLRLGTDDIKKSPSSHVFKSRLKNYLFDKCDND